MMEYRKVGRGGAGNFYNPQEIEKTSIEKTKARKWFCYFYRTALTTFQDVEAQRNAASGMVENLQSQDRRLYIAGRGGAGNVTTRDVLAAGTKANVDVTPSLQENKLPKLGHYGRGGAGNYRTPEPEKRREVEKIRLEAQEKAQRNIVELKEPEKAHLGREGLPI